MSEPVLSPFIIKQLGAYAQYPPEVQSEVVKLMLKMTSFGFISKFTKAEVGPLVTTYYFEPSPQAALSSIYSREDDLALGLSVESIMVSRELGNITIAVPRAQRDVIKFDECLFNLFSNPVSRDAALPILMGKTLKGEPLFMDLASQPHLLIAGATGSGKSIFTAQAICSLALRRTPQELEFILADTKQLDLVLFEKLEHVSSVIRNIHDLRDTLQNLIALVRSRTAIMSGYARNVVEWNSATKSPMKYKVLIIDEFADVVGSDREWLNTLPKKERPEAIDTLTQRLAQISRAAGIHIILATQRPSVKIISGDIKTNFPARIAFKLPSMQDSRVILDENGAEKLLGRGDYLYKIAGSDVVKRAHSAFVEIKDISLILEQHESLREQFQLT